MILYAFDTHFFQSDVQLIQAINIFLSVCHYKCVFFLSSFSVRAQSEGEVQTQAEGLWEEKRSHAPERRQRACHTAEETKSGTDG